MKNRKPEWYREKHKEMWSKIITRYEDCCDDEEDPLPDIEELKRSIVQDMGCEKEVRMAHNCFMCAYIIHTLKMNCLICPLAVEFGSCYLDGSLFHQLEDSIENQDKESVVRIAKQIREAWDFV